MTNPYTHEVWKPIPGFDGWYSVSSLGRLRRDVGGGNTHAGHIFKSRPNRTGYVFATLSANGTAFHTSIHRLVAMTFIGLPSEDADHVDHIDGNRSNNVPENLRWVSQAQNQRLADIRTGGRPGSRGQPRRAVLNVDQVRVVRATARLMRDTAWRSVLAESWGVSVACIKDIVNGRTWRQHVMDRVRKTDLWATASDGGEQ